MGAVYPLLRRNIVVWHTGESPAWNFITPIVAFRAAITHGCATAEHSAKVPFTAEHSILTKTLAVLTRVRHWITAFSYSPIAVGT